MIIPLDGIESIETSGENYLPSFEVQDKIDTTNEESFGNNSSTVSDVSEKQRSSSDNPLHLQIIGKKDILVLLLFVSLGVLGAAI